MSKKVFVIFSSFTDAKSFSLCPLLLIVISPFLPKIPSIGIFPTLALQSPATMMYSFLFCLSVLEEFYRILLFVQVSPPPGHKQLIMLNILSVIYILVEEFFTNM